MTFKTKAFTISERAQVDSASNIYWNMAVFFALTLRWAFDDSNETHTTASTYGMGLVSHGSMDSDGEYILTLGHGTYSGVGVFKVANDGSITTIYQDRYPRTSYTTYNSFAVRKDATKKMIFAGNYVYDEIFEYDFGNSWENTPTKTQRTQATHGLPEDETGDAYHTGLCVAGSYLYMSPEPTSSATQYRWNIDTQTADNITVINKVSNANDGRMWYDEVNDRVYQQSQVDGDIWVTINPQNATNHATAPAKTFNINSDAASGMFDDAYTMGVVADNDNPNHLWIMQYYWRIAKLDITDILAETATAPTVLLYSDTVQTAQPNSWPMGWASYNHLDTHPVHGSDLIMIQPDRGFNQYFGWLDIETGIPVIQRRGSNDYDWNSSTINRDVYTESGELIFDYAPNPVKVVSADSTEYYVVGGYGQDGNKLRTYTIDKAAMETSGYIVWGDFSLDDSSDIRAVQITKLKDDVHTPTGCTFAVHVSNDGGSTWEVYAYNDESVHIFSSTGDTVQVKVLLTGSGTASAYIQAPDYPTLTVFGESLEHDDIIPIMPQKYNVKGI